MSNFTVAWIVWLLYFIVLEGVALSDHRPGDTLSEHVWRWFKADRRWRSWRWFTLVAFMVWLTLHFAFGWFR